MASTEEPQSDGKDLSARLDSLLRAVEHHRLMFLYWAQACRRNPHAVRSRTGENERVSRDEVRGWSEMLAAIDSTGAFLWTHRDVLERYAQAAIDAFGPDSGVRPTELDADGRRIPVVGSSDPYWALDEDSPGYLEQSSDAVLQACRALAERSASGSLSAVITQVSSVARPQQQPRWYSGVVVNWSYLAALDSAIALIKTALVEASRPQTANPGSDVAPEPLVVADLAVLFMVARDAIRINRDYPKVLSDVDQKAWVHELMGQADRLLTQPGFEDLLAFLRMPELRGVNTELLLSSLMSVTMTKHPAMADIAGKTSAEIKAAIDRIMNTCQATASPYVSSQMERLDGLMIVSCRSPTGKSVKGVSDPARFFQLLQSYWSLVHRLVQTQATVDAGFRPHPLLHLIENIHDRLNTCFARVLRLDGASEAKQTCDQLIAMLTEGDGDDLSAVPEWTFGQLQAVERFIARARLQVGPNRFELTAAEDYFINKAHHLISEHDERVRGAWKQVMAGADPNTLAYKPAKESQSPPDSGNGPLHMIPREECVKKIGQLLSSLIAADNGILSLGATLRSIALRGKAANTSALTVTVREQLQKCVDPIMVQLKVAETASNGIGPHLQGLIAEPVAWEVDTRLAIRALKEHLTGLVLSNGSEMDESLVLGVAADLYSRGQRLQAAHEALWADMREDVGRASKQPAASGDNTSSLPPQAPLTKDHEAILAVLARSPGKCMLINDVVAAKVIRDRGTVGRLLGELEGLGLVHRPHGKRKGVVLTPAAIKRLADERAET